MVGIFGVVEQIILSSDNYYYYVSFVDEMNPNNIDIDSYSEFVGKTIDDVLKYVHTFLIENRYVPEIDREPIYVMGGAYDRYYLAKKWAMEELEEESMVKI